MSEPKFTVALIAKNEEKTLPRLLASLKEFQERGGEIRLLDTGSTDKTVEVAESLGCKVHAVGDKFKIILSEEEAIEINNAFQDRRDGNYIVAKGDQMFDFASARNYIAAFALNDIIAMPDCDEVYTKLDIDAVNKLIEEGVDQFEYNFVFSHDENGNDLIKFTHSKFYNRLKMNWVGVVHEVLQETPTVTVKTINKKFVDENVIFLEHYQNETTNRSQYLVGLAIDCFRNPENDRNSHYFGRELFYKGFYFSAIRELKRHIKMKKWPTEASQSMIFIGDCYWKLGDREEAINWYTKSIDLEPNRREALMKLAEMAYSERDPQRTIIWTAAALQVRGMDFYANYQPNYEYLPHEYMYWALWQKEEYTASKAHFDICFAYQPFNPKYLHDFRFYYELPNIDIVVQSSTEDMKEFNESVEKLNYPSEKIKVLSLNESTADWFVSVNGNAVFDEQSLMIAFKTLMDNKKYCLFFNDSAFLMHKKLLKKTGDDLQIPSKEELQEKGQYMESKRAIIRDL